MDFDSGFHLLVVYIPILCLFIYPLIVPATIFAAYKTKRAWLQPACYTAIMLGLIIYEIIRSGRKGFNLKAMGYEFSWVRVGTTCLLYFPFIAMTVACTAYGRYIRKAGR